MTLSQPSEKVMIDDKASGPVPVPSGLLQRKMTKNFKMKKIQYFTLFFILNFLLAHLSRRLVDELIVYPWFGVRPSSSSSTISNTYSSATSWPITTKFYLKHHWVTEKAA